MSENLLLAQPCALELRLLDLRSRVPMCGL